MSPVSRIASGEVIFGINTRADPISFSIMENVKVGDQIELDITRLQDAGTFAGVSLTIGLTFAGMPGKVDCYGQSAAALASHYGGLNAAATALAFSSVSALQKAILTYCGG